MRGIIGFISRWWVVALIIVAWYLIAATGLVSPEIVPGPATVVATLAQHLDLFLVPIGRTLLHAAGGLVIGVVSGYAFAASTWLVPTMSGMMLPLALILRSVPFVALVPVLARVFGYGPTAALVICALVCFFPTFVLVSSGLRDVPDNSEELFVVNGASRVQRFWRLAVPAAMPNLGTAIRISAGVSILAALVAEFVMGIQGLARVLIDALISLDTALVWAASLVAVVLSVSAFLLASWNESRMESRWR